MCGHYSRAATDRGRKLFEEIRYVDSHSEGAARYWLAIGTDRELMCRPQTRMKKCMMMMMIIMNKSQETTVFGGRQKLTSAMK